jgi:predicted signal transduction protein with EAL and GGDEF domain
MLDDFGTGYSSLSYLQLFPFDFVKIDRPFVNRTSSDRANTGMMAAMVQMARSLNLTAVAEIIETEAAAAALKEMGCDYGQGYYFSEPIDAEHALQRLRTQDPFQPSESADDTAMVRPLAQPAPAKKVRSHRVDEADDSPTIMIPSDSIEFPPHEDE